VRLVQPVLRPEPENRTAVLAANLDRKITGVSQLIQDAHHPRRRVPHRDGECQEPPHGGQDRIDSPGTPHWLRTWPARHLTLFSHCRSELQPRHEQAQIPRGLGPA
jgi:hypothetical protein